MTTCHRHGVHTRHLAKVLGDTSIGAMEKYYAGFFKKRPPVYA
jgi:hypothetical protein